MPNALSRAMLLIIASIVLAACNFNTVPPTPTVEGLMTATPTSATQEVSPTASLTLTNPPTVPAIRLASATPSNTPQAPTETSTPTPTQGPYVHRVVSGDTLTSIILKYGYNDGRVFAAILALNPNIPNENSMPVGQDILIPRMTYTPTPPNYEATVAIMESLGIRPPDQLPDNTEISCYTVLEGQSIIDIVEEFNTTLEVISRFNPEISFAGCDFNNRSGGPSCSPLIRTGQCVNVPLPTPTPTLSPTPSGNETATPTPTYSPPITINPPNGATIGGAITLQWVSVGMLKADEQYYIEVTDRTAGTSHTWVTQNTSLRLPPELIPPEGEQHDMEWRVIVVRGDGENFTVIGGTRSGSLTFKWQRR